MRQFDVVVATDCRFPGGTSSSVVEEIRAQARFGYKTGLLHVFSDKLKRRRPFNPKITQCINEGLVELIYPKEKVKTALLILRHPTVFKNIDTLGSAVISKERIIIVNQAPSDSGVDRLHYDPEEVDTAITKAFGGSFTWYPIGPEVRRMLGKAKLNLAKKDWYNIIDVKALAVPRKHFAGEKPVIGRHGRDDLMKWPKQEDLHNAYPEFDNYEIKILGGATSLINRDGSLPNNWEVFPYRTDNLVGFLKEIDFFVYFHHPDLVEAFGRTIIEALASGAVAILPPHFKELFGESCIYTEASGVKKIVDDLYKDLAKYKRQSEIGQNFVESNFSYELHKERLEHLIGKPANISNIGNRANSSHPKRVVFMSSNGAGTGHLTRLMAMAKRSKAGITPIFFTLSQAVSVVESEGYTIEYLSTISKKPEFQREWHGFLQTRIESLLKKYEPEALIFDGTHPYAGLLKAMKKRDTKFIWSRRAMWKRDTPDSQKKQVMKADLFDLVIEPGEWAKEADRGITTEHKHQVYAVEPITFLDYENLVDKDEAIKALGLKPDVTRVLVQLGAGNINDLGSTLGFVMNELKKLPNTQVFITKTIIESEGRKFGAEVVHKTIYPLSKYLKGFDFAISAAGYNTFHEVVNFGLPALFLPNDKTATDDQLARARYAQEMHAAVFANEEDQLAIAAGIRFLADAKNRQEMVCVLETSRTQNGAEKAMSAIEELIK